MRLQIVTRILIVLVGAMGATRQPKRPEITHGFANPLVSVDVDIFDPDFWARLTKAREILMKRNPNSNPSPAKFFLGFCRSKGQGVGERRRWKTDTCIDISPRVGYAVNHYDLDNVRLRWSWSVWAEKVDTGKYASGTLAILVLDEREQNRPPLAGAIVTDPDLAPTNFSVLLPGHYRWGEEVTNNTSVYLPSPLFPKYWCRVWASGARLTVHHNQNYTVIHTLETALHEHPVRHGAPLTPTRGASRTVPEQAKCTSFGFPEGNTDLRRVDAKVVECGELRTSDSSGEPYFCAEFAQDTGIVEWDVPQARRWPIFCQNWTSSNSINEVDGGDGPFLLTGFVRNLKVVEGRAIAVSHYFDLESSLLGFR